VEEDHDLAHGLLLGYASAMRLASIGPMPVYSGSNGHRWFLCCDLNGRPPREGQRRMSDERMIVTKRRIYRLAPDEQGQPVEEALKLPENLRLFLKGAKLYQTPDGPVIARPDDSQDDD
jgi:hypothetical protein